MQEQTRDASVHVAVARQEFRFSTIRKFIEQQKVLDMSMTLADLADRVGREVDAVAGYTFVWDKYIYDVGLVLPRDPVVSRGAVRERSQRILDLNTKLSDLQTLVSSSDIDRVAGYIYTEDKKTFIVATVIDELGTGAVGK